MRRMLKALDVMDVLVVFDVQQSGGDCLADVTASSTAGEGVQRQHEVKNARAFRLGANARIGS
jgi:hypothetical protein